MQLTKVYWGYYGSLENVIASVNLAVMDNYLCSNVLAHTKCQIHAESTPSKVNSATSVAFIMEMS